MMNKNIFQPIFKNNTIDKLRSSLRKSESLHQYFEEKIQFDESELLPSSIEVSGKVPVLKVPKKKMDSADLDNAIALHEYYKNLNETQASDPRLWTYLSHVEFRKYTMERWGFAKSFKELANDIEKNKAINYFLEHWFVGSNDRELRRHSIARLWWAAHLTYAPWEKDPEYFGALKKSDPYYYTKVLLSKEDIFQQVLERSMGRSPRILISLLEYLDTHPDFAERGNMRGLIKELNLIYGVKKIIALNYSDLESLITKIASEVQPENESIKTRALKSLSAVFK